MTAFEADDPHLPTKAHGVNELAGLGAPAPDGRRETAYPHAVLFVNKLLIATGTPAVV